MKNVSTELNFIEISNKEKRDKIKQDEAKEKEII